MLSVQLEKRYTKNEIIAMYLNIYDFGYNADGVRSAAKIFFNTTPQELTIEQSAMLVGMLKNSSLYNPIRRPERVLQRRNVVFQQMVRNELLTAEERDSLSALPITIDYTPESHREGLATYFRAYLQEFLQQWIKDNPKPDGTRYDLYGDGLRIYTTIDARLQELAENAVKQHMKNLQKEFMLQNTKKLNPTAPFLELREGQVDTLLTLTAKYSERWRQKAAAGWDEDAILANFKEPTPMQLFSWDGEIDTIMSPLDSIRYYKLFYGLL